MGHRNIAVIGDGATDIAIFLKIIAEVILSSDSLTTVELNRQSNLHDCVERYWTVVKKKKEKEYYLPSEHATQLQKDVTNILMGAFDDFENRGTSIISNQDILLVTTDAEIVLSKPNDYFQEWAFSISKIFMGAIDKFYNIKTIEGYYGEYLPLIIPIVTFPCNEIFVAAAKNISNPYGKKPSELKILLYGTDDLATLREEELQEKALDFITPDSIQRIFSCLPESRIFIQMLSFGKVTLEQNYET
ncbi:hypothetical protein [Microseira wollei]|uniref:Uncharacterized protein n=1 Tax=Microseira wollei NIES-4236 TaxID=2530354 RepID=A0AAV3X2Q9_9CYAN|nr:hypothetical protein [Microseira wollei]GET35431.1 hypothetical protein MiSe_01730 [Microseira wollei NIES-4236]